MKTIDPLSLSPDPRTGEPIDWRCDRLQTLQPLLLHRLLRARQQVFVIEQDCAYLDADMADEAAWHLTAWLPDRQLAACARIVDAGVKYAEPSIGRVMTTLARRGSGIGRELMRRAISAAQLHHPGSALRISAQLRLQRFYSEFGFSAVGEPYLEDDLPHIEMLRGVD